MKIDTKINMASISKRISAYLIDILFVFILIGLISEIRFINSSYDKYMEAYESYNQILDDYTNEIINETEFNELYNDNYYYVSRYSISYNFVIVMVILLYFGVFQKFNNGQTIGKKIMKIKVVNNNDESKVSVIRFLIRTLPMYYIYIGGVIPVLLNSILVFILNENNFMNITMLVSYIFLIVSIVSFIMLSVRKDGRGLHDLLANTKVIYIEK